MITDNAINKWIKFHERLFPDVTLKQQKTKEEAEWKEMYEADNIDDEAKEILDVLICQIGLLRFEYKNKEKFKLNFEHTREYFGVRQSALYKRIERRFVNLGKRDWVKNKKEGYYSIKK